MCFSWKTRFFFHFNREKLEFFLHCWIMTVSKKACRKTNNFFLKAQNKNFYCSSMKKFKCVKIIIFFLPQCLPSCSKSTIWTKLAENKRNIRIWSIVKTKKVENIQPLIAHWLICLSKLPKLLIDHFPQLSIVRNDTIFLSLDFCIDILSKWRFATETL